MRDQLAVYLGYGVALIGHEHGSPNVLDHPPAWPVSRVLSELSVPRVPARRSIHVYLGGFYCPIVSFPIPRGLRDASELRALATHAASRTWECLPAEVEIALDWTRQGMAAAIHISTREALTAWAQSENLRVSRIAPLWAKATDCAIYRQSDASEFMLREPGTVTLIASGTQFGRSVTTLLGSTVISDDVLPDRKSSEPGNGIGSALELMFHPRTAISGRTKDMPTVWGAHWERL